MRIPYRRQAGFTLVELMVAITIGLLVVAGMTTLFVNNNNAQNEIERANRQVENGRYAMDLIASDLRNAGFFGEFDPTEIAVPAAVPDACSTDLDDIKAGLSFPVSGADAADAASLTCLQEYKSGTDVLVVRHADTCFADDPDCDPIADGGPFIQVSLCQNAAELNSGDPATYYGVSTDATALTLHQRDCATVAGVRRLLTRIYYVASGNSTSNIPTLKRADIVSSTDGTVSVSIVALAEGIENLQLEYGIDSSNDGVADAYTTDPATHGGCAAAACAVTNWTEVVSVRLNVLARNTEESLGHTDTKSYVLGSLSDGSPNTIAAANDHYKRHVFQSLVGLPNVVGRKKP